MLKLGQTLAFLQEFVSLFLKLANRDTAARMNCGSSAQTPLSLRKELLERHSPIQSGIPALVGDPEAPLSQHPLNKVGSALKHGPSRKHLLRDRCLWSRKGRAT